MSKWNHEKRLVLDVTRLMVQRGLVVGTSGNVSHRIKSAEDYELLAITPSSRYYNTLSIGDIQVIDFNNDHVEGELAPSVETLLHIGIYRARKYINAIIHTHSVFASAISVSGQAIPPIMEDQVMSVGGGIKIAEYAPSNSPKQVANILATLEERYGVLLANHGAIGIGRTIQEAFDVCEIIEKTSRIYYLASSLGRVHLLSEEAFTDCRAIFNRNLNQD